MTAFTIIEARAHHCGQIIRKLRINMATLLADQGVDAHADLRACFDASSFRRAWLADGELMAVGGVLGSELTSAAIVWLAVADDAKRYKVAMMKEAKAQIASLMETRHELIASIYRGDAQAEAFARWLGFEAHSEMPDHGAFRIMRMWRDEDAGRSWMRRPYAPEVMVSH